MRSFCIVIVSLALCIFASTASYGAQSDSLTVKVTVTPSLSVSIAETELALGQVAAGGTSLSTTGVTVTNDGSGINETYALSLTNPAGWTASQTAAANETYVLNAAFDADGSAITWDNANQALSTTAVACSATKFAGDQTGVNVPYNATRKLWFQFKAPTATTVGTEQGIAVTITAQTP
jgi:hypothetical protein